MKHAYLPHFESYKRIADVLVVPFWEGGAEAAPLGGLKSLISPVLNLGDFKAKQGETVFVYPSGERALLLGLGKKEGCTAESLRRAYGAAVRQILTKKCSSAAFFFPSDNRLTKQEAVHGVVEGVLLANYAFTRLKGESAKESGALLSSIDWIGLQPSDQALVEKIQTICSSVRFAREMINGNADEVTPQWMAEQARKIAKEHPKVAVDVFDKRLLEQHKMGLILAVNRGSSSEPCLIQASFRGQPQSNKHIVLVGKGITYDTGGLSLKPTDSMLHMKCDMAGGATVLAALQAAAALDLKVNVTALVPATENSIGPDSYKVGDVYRSYSGKTIEVTNTDAEGRLVLADAIAYAVAQLHPTCLIDLATLTGNAVMALGEEFSGLFSNRDELARELLSCSEQTSELVWRMPLYADYLEAYKSDIADLANSGGREAGAIKAALFLQEFVGQTPWAHFDIAGPAYWAKPKHYAPTRSTGYGVRLLVDFLEKRQGA